MHNVFSSQVLLINKISQKFLLPVMNKALGKHKITILVACTRWNWKCKILECGLIKNTWKLRNVPEITFFPPEEYKTIQSLSYISFKVFPLCNYTLLPATVKVLETFLAAILWKPFQFFGSILNDVSSITKGPFFSGDFCRRKR
jgi:hypothetical protein